MGHGASWRVSESAFTAATFAGIMVSHPFARKKAKGWSTARVGEFAEPGLGTWLFALQEAGTGWAQWEQRLAASGISLRHSGQGLVLGGAATTGGVILLSMYCMGSTMAK
jgi:hypothetical protein